MLNPELLANFTRGPLVQNMSSNQVQIIWKTPVPADSTVEFGPAGKLDGSLTDTNLVLNHAVTLPNLTPDTGYLYRIASAGGDRLAVSPIAAFRTFSTGGPVEFVVVGDTGHGGLPQQRIASVMAAQKADLVMHVGDVIYPRFTAGQMDQKCFSIYRAQMRGTPFFYAIGNHEYYGGGASFLAEIQQPSNNPSQNKAYYSFDHGDAHFVVLDSVVPYGNGYAPDSPQYRWLEKDLAGSQKPWKFLFFHNTIHSSGPHHQDDYNINGIPDHLELQEALGKLASQYGVQMIFTGHDHIYERSNPVNGVVTIVSGGGGAALYQFGGKWDEASNQFWSRYNCVKVSVRENTLKLSALGLEGEVFDEMTLQTAPPPREIYPSAWHSPPLDSRPSNIADGNIPGQKLDFRGTPVPAKSGKNACPGRLWVNNDDYNLYVGLDQVAISGSQNILLFVQYGDTGGRTGMSGLGDGIYNPDAEGAEALDALENLGFTNFAPSIGCILGDQFADGQFRAHGRTNNIFSGGQGIFFLTPGFPDVPGVLLQQFNRSPQQSALMADRSAQLIALSIPLDPLSLVPGAKVRIAAIVANDFDPTNGISTMQTLDAGYIGAAMGANANGDILLEGVEFRLSRNPFPVLAGLRLEITPPSEGLLRIRWQATPGTQYGLDFFEPGMNEFAPLSAPGLPWTATNTLGICDLEWPRSQALSPMRLFRLRAVR
jgi:predicted phosphodiesterase